MPLPTTTARKLLHTRHIHCCGYEREDGLYDIEAHISDVKSYSFDNRHRGTVSAGQPVHDMWLRLTVDEHLVIHAAEASTDAAPFAICPAITERYRQLVGLRIGPGWRGKLKALFGGVDGCTHLTELLGPLATTAYQTLSTRRSSARAQSDADAAAIERRPAIIDSCHAFASDGEVVKVLWPRFYTGVPDR